MLCPVCKKVALHPLAGIDGAFGCESCRGCWLDHRLLGAIGEPLDPGVDAIPVRAHDRSEGPRGCPTCGADLARVFVTAPTPVEVDRCTAHGTWLEAHDLPAITRNDLAYTLARALLAMSTRMDPAERVAALDTLDGLRRRGAGLIDWVRPRGNPARVTLGIASIFPGGVSVVGVRGHEPLVPPRSPTTWPLILLGTGAFMMVACAFGLIGQPLWLAIGVEAAFALLFLVIVGVSYAVARASSRHALIVDSVKRALVEVNGERVVTIVPAAIVRSVRVQLYADLGYADRHDVLCPLGFAELWIDQTTDLEAATSMARKVAVALGVPYDPQLERKS